MEFTFVFIVIDEMIAYQHTFKIHAVLVSVMSVITFILSLGYDKKKKLGWYHLDFTYQKKKKFGIWYQFEVRLRFWPKPNHIIQTKIAHA